MDSHADQPESGRPGILTLAPRGELELSSSRDLGARLQEAAGAVDQAAVVDLSQVRFIDSSGLGVLLKAQERFRRRDVPLLFVCPEEGAFVRLLDATGLTGKVEVHPTREAALASAGLQD